MLRVQMTLIAKTLDPMETGKPIKLTFSVQTNQFKTTNLEFCVSRNDAKSVEIGESITLAEWDDEVV